MTNDELIELVCDIVESNVRSEWVKGDPEYDLTGIEAGISEVSIFPENAKTLDEIESFIIFEDVSGTISTKFSRQK